MSRDLQSFYGVVETGLCLCRSRMGAMASRITWGKALSAPLRSTQACAVKQNDPNQDRDQARLRSTQACAVKPLVRSVVPPSLSLRLIW